MKKSQILVTDELPRSENFDKIDYDKHFKYTITPKGMELLKKAYINDLAKLYGTTAKRIESLTA